MSATEALKDCVPEEIPQEKDNRIDEIKKRRSSLRRSSAGFGSTLKAVCSSIDESLAPADKKRRIAEICINQTLMDLKFRALDNENDAVTAFSNNLRSKMEDILSKISHGVGTPSQKQETKSVAHISLIEKEKTLWNEEFSNRRKRYQDARQRLKDVLKGQRQIETQQRLNSEDQKFLKGLPDFSSINKKIAVYQNRHCLGLIHLEKVSQRVYRSLEKYECQLNDVQTMLAPPTVWPLGLH